MASPSHQSYGFKAREPLAQDLCQGFVNLEVPAQPSLCSGQGPFLQAPASFDQEEQQQVVVASNDLPVSDMDLANFLEMDDKTLSGEPLGKLAVRVLMKEYLPLCVCVCVQS